MSSARITYTPRSDATPESELDLMMRLTGFEVEAVYGGFEGEPFSSTSDHLIILVSLSKPS